MIGLLAAGPSLLSGAISGKKKNIKKEKLLETKSSGGGGGALVRSGETGKNIKSSSALVKYQAPSIEKVTSKKSNAGGELNGLTVVINEIRSNLSQIRGFIAARKNASLKGLVEHKKSVKLGKAKKREKELETKKPIKGIGSKIKSIPGPGFSIGNFFTMLLLGSVLNFLLRHQKTIFEMFDDVGEGLTNIWTALKFGIVSLTHSLPKAIKSFAKFRKKLFESKPVKMLGNTFKKLGTSLKKTFLKVGARIGGFVKDVYKGVGKRFSSLTGGGSATALRGKPANNIRPFKKPKAPKPTPKPKGLRLEGRARAVFGKQGLKRLSKLGNLFKRIPFIGALLAIGIDLALGERLDNAIAGAMGASMGAWIGGAIGTGVLPIPFVGTFLGGVIGAAIGDWFGKQLYKKISGQLEGEVEPPELIEGDQSTSTTSTTSTTGGTGGSATGGEIGALLDTIAFAEGTAHMPNNGYNTHFGHSQTEDLSKHPDKVITKNGISSTAFGRYQFLTTTWDSVGGGAMTPKRQDWGATRLILMRLGLPQNQAGAKQLEKMLQTNGLTPQIIDALAPEWASFPNLFGPDQRGRVGTNTSFYGQGGKSLNQLQAEYKKRLKTAGSTGSGDLKTAKKTQVLKPGDGTFEGEIKRVSGPRGRVKWKKWKIDEDGEGSWWTQTGSHAVQAKKDWKKQQQQNSEPTATPDNSDKNLTKGITPSSASSSSSAAANIASTPATSSGTSASVSQQTSYGPGIRKRTVFYPTGDNQTMGGAQSMSVGRVIPVMPDTKEALNRYHALQILEFLYKNG